METTNKNSAAQRPGGGPAGAGGSAGNQTGGRNNHTSRKSPSENGDGNSETSGGAPRLYHTLTACTRCRSRKTRCDAGLPNCGPCERSGTHCEFFDATKQKTIPRSYVVHLQNKVRALQEEVARREAVLAEAESSPNNEDLVRGIGAVKFDNYEHYKEPRYVGSSSGITVTRLVLESAKRDLDEDEFKDMTMQHRKNAVHHTSPEPPLSPKQVDTKLPPRRTGETLVSFFCKKALYMLPVLHEPTFMKEVADVYEGSTDPFKCFKLKMVLAISLQKGSKKYATVADSYFLSGLRHLEQIMEPMDHSTLQCLLIMVQYALVKPTRIAAYHVVGLCVRLCIQLGYHQERTIMLSEQPLDPITKDMRRRFFWTLASMEYGLSHVLGRPSAFATSDAYVDVKFYEPVDDAYITAGGILPAPPSAKKLISMHFFGMRRLQAEVRRTLYQNPTETPKTDRDPWFIQMYEKCNNWKASCPSDDEGSGLSKTWFEHRYNNILIFMYRPSPQIPQPSLEATIMCYNCAVENVRLEKAMFETGAVDLTWVFLHQVYTVTLTIIWAIYNPKIRKMNPKSEVEGHIRCQIRLILALAEYWPGAEAAADLFMRLAGAALRNYDTDLRKSPASQASASASPPVQPHYTDHHSSPSSGKNGPTTPYTLSDGGRSASDTPSPHSAPGMSTFDTVYESNLLETPGGFPHTSASTSPPAVPAVPTEPSYRDFQGMIFDPNFSMNPMFAPPSNPQQEQGIPDWLQAWDPHSPSSNVPMNFGPPPAGPPPPPPPPPPAAPLSFMPQNQSEILNQQAQHDELIRILENEASSMHEFDYDGSQRQWVGYGGEEFF